MTRGSECFEIESTEINEGKRADLTWFDPDKRYKLSENELKSTSKNCAYLGQELHGKVLGSFNNGILTLNE